MEEQIEILKSKFICPLGKKIEECTPDCTYYDLCEEWKTIMFTYMEEVFGSLIRGLFLR